MARDPITDPWPGDLFRRKGEILEVLDAPMTTIMLRKVLSGVVITVPYHNWVAVMQGPGVELLHLAS